MLRIWDVFLFEGAIVLFKVALAMLTIRERDLCALEDASAMFNALSDLPSTMGDPDFVMNLRFKGGGDGEHVHRRDISSSKPLFLLQSGVFAC